MYQEALCSTLGKGTWSALQWRRREPRAFWESVNNATPRSKGPHGFSPPWLPQEIYQAPLSLQNDSHYLSVSGLQWGCSVLWKVTGDSNGCWWPPLRTEKDRLSWRKWLLSHTLRLAAEGGTAARPWISGCPFTKAVQMGCSALGTCPDLGRELGALASHFFLDSSWRFFAIGDLDERWGLLALPPDPPPL